MVGWLLFWFGFCIGAGFGFCVVIFKFGYFLLILKLCGVSEYVVQGFLEECLYLLVGLWLVCLHYLWVVVVV